ncbi:MAX dimerization protein MLX [Phyllostomus discolor]|uniref:MAX dimerization protein MLX n=1 Tax=Phyllostomus discolor TaxID=89673 RepID=A0A833ZMW6_9CHIR|nr:MAX dimerization protein MLX [Phyllostomus discolor]
MTRTVITTRSPTRSPTRTGGGERTLRLNRKGGTPSRGAMTTFRPLSPPASSRTSPLAPKSSAKPSFCRRVRPGSAPAGLELWAGRPASLMVGLAWWGACTGRARGWGQRKQDPPCPPTEISSVSTPFPPPAIDYIQFLHKEKKKQEEEVSTLRKDVMALKIMKVNYEQIVKAHQDNPHEGEDQVSDQVKFNVFQGIMDSLFQSFNASVSMASFQELSACVFSWIEEHCKPQVWGNSGPGTWGLLPDLRHRDPSHFQKSRSQVLGFFRVCLQL